MMDTGQLPSAAHREKNRRYCEQHRKGGPLLPYNSRITGQVIRMLRIQRGVSQEVLSGFAGIPRSHLSGIERGVKNANVDTLWRIADALDLRLSELLRMAEELMDRQSG